MYNHRIVPDGIKFQPSKETGVLAMLEFMGALDRQTIPITSEWDVQQVKALAEITKSEWDEIWNGFFRLCANTDRPDNPEQKFLPFHQYLSDLLSLVPLKGLAVEEIRKLSEVNK